jgi:hypothetical protein
MGTKKISFIDPSAPCLHIFSKFPIPPLGAVLLATILRSKNVGGTPNQFRLTTPVLR